MQFIIADDHPLFRTAMAHTLRQRFSGAQISEVGSLPELLSLLKTGIEVDLLLLDLHIPEAHGFTGLVQVNEHFPEVPIMIVSGNDHSSVIHKAVALGASGFLPKSSSNEDIAVAIDAVVQGQVWIPANLPAVAVGLGDEQTAERIASLTPQQLRVLTMIGEGLYNKQIASELSVTDATVRAHVTEIFRKLGVTNRTQAVIFFNRLKVEDPHHQSI
ncbi:response regulator transcription factor [Candidatus Njordibacter sp. Uisw_039]|jgi:DNA-binding NarL/FixJ family response regulator|uniref:response regulator n=1 Tax=Candidatus Njordibacter sp. Uisw_039 TaxID=3230972 RepID=UPI003A2BD10B|tara:strand:+ start:7604 stop:8251 length:648 start_codon:yes stop_codon:yes gene_type:complete